MSRPIEVLLHHMPTIADRAENAWARDFSRSILRQSKRRHWNPSPKQREIMDRLVNELFGQEEELIVIE